MSKKKPKFLDRVAQKIFFARCWITSQSSLIGPKTQNRKTLIGTKICHKNPSKNPIFVVRKWDPQEVVLFLTLEVVPKLTLERLKSGTETNSPAYIYIYPVPRRFQNCATPPLRLVPFPFFGVAPLYMGKTGTIWQFFRALFPSTWRDTVSRCFVLPGFGTHPNTQNLPHFRAFPASIQEHSLPKCLFSWPNRPGFALLPVHPPWKEELEVVMIFLTKLGSTSDWREPLLRKPVVCCVPFRPLLQPQNPPKN